MSDVHAVKKTEQEKRNNLLAEDSFENEDIKLQKAERQVKSYVPLNKRLYQAQEDVANTLQEGYQTWSVTGLRDAMDRGDYKAVGRTFKGSRTRRRAKGRKAEKNKHSERMTDLIKTIDLLEKQLKKKVNPKTAEKDIEKLKEIYDNIFQYAYIYCEKRDPMFKEGKARKDMVLLIRDQANEERLRIANNARALVEDVKCGRVESCTYEQAVIGLRTRKIHIGEDGVTGIAKGGKGTSDLIVVEKDGHKMYIRRSERLKKDAEGPDAFYRDTIAAGEKRLAELENDNSPEAEKEREVLTQDLEIQRILLSDLELFRDHPKNMKKLERACRKITFSSPSELSGLYEEEFVKKNPAFEMMAKGFPELIRKAKEEEVYKKYREEKNALLKDFIALNELNKKATGIQKRINREEMDKIQSVIDVLDKEFDQKDTLFARIFRATKDTGKLINQRDFARNVANIPDGGNVSNRNVAASIMARALGIRDIVAESEMVEVEIDGEIIHGVVMEEAQGGDLKKIKVQKNAEGKSMRYSTKALKDLANLHLFDVLCGQIDRKSDNYMSVVEDNDKNEAIVTKIKAIDNDMCFGLLDYEEDIVNCMDTRRQLQGVRQQLPCISDRDGNLILDAVDYVMAKRLLAMRTSFIDFFLTGILTEEERLSMKRRLVTIQKILRDRILREKYSTEQTVFLKNEKDWERYRDMIERVGHELHSYILPIYKRKNR